MSGLGQGERPWETFCVSLLMHLLLPLLPLLIEFVVTEAVANESLILLASIYPVSIGISSRSKAQFAFTIFPSLFYAAIYGHVVEAGSARTGILVFAWVVIAVVLVTHAWERYNRHVVERRPFLVFW